MFGRDTYVKWAAKSIATKDKTQAISVPARIAKAEMRKFLGKRVPFVGVAL